MFACWLTGSICGLATVPFFCVTWDSEHPGEITLRKTLGSFMWELSGQQQPELNLCGEHSAVKGRCSQQVLSL